MAPLVPATGRSPSRRRIALQFLQLWRLLGLIAALVQRLPDDPRLDYLRLVASYLSWAALAIGELLRAGAVEKKKQPGAQI